MIAWLDNNIGTILVSVILIAAVSFAISLLVRNKKEGISSCGCDCAGCTKCSCKAPCDGHTDG